MNEKTRAMEEKKNYSNQSALTLTGLAELAEALRKHQGKNVDKRFFEEHFLLKNEYRDWTKYRLSLPDFSWSAHKYELRVSKDCKLNLLTRETKHILEEVEKQTEIEKARIVRYAEEIEALKGIDEDALIADLRALYQKHGKPETWGKILDLYQVKYPEEKI